MDRRIQGKNRVLVLDEIAQLTVFFVANGRFQRDRLLGDFHHLANLFQRHLQLLCQFFRRRLPADFMQHLAAGPHQLVDRFDHMHRDPDRAGLIRDGAGDGLPDPPGGICGELVAPTIFKFIDGLHQADVAFLDQIKELQAAVCVFLGDRDDEAQVCFDHFFLGLTRFLFTLLNLLHNAPEFGDIDAHILADLGHFDPQFRHLLRGAFKQRCPATARLGAHPVHPRRIKLVIAVFFDEFPAVDACLISQFHHIAVDRHDTAVDPVKLIDQRFDPVVVQVEFVHQLNNLGTQFLIAGFIRS